MRSFIISTIVDDGRVEIDFFIRNKAVVVVTLETLGRFADVLPNGGANDFAIPNIASRCILTVRINTT